MIACNDPAGGAEEHPIKRNNMREYTISFMGQTADLGDKEGFDFIIDAYELGYRRIRFREGVVVDHKTPGNGMAPERGYLGGTWQYAKDLKTVTFIIQVH